MQFLTWLLSGLLTSLVASSATDYLPQAIALMEQSPLLDTHIDLLQIIRSLSTYHTSPRCRSYSHAWKRTR